MHAETRQVSLDIREHASFYGIRDKLINNKTNNIIHNYILWYLYEERRQCDLSPTNSPLRRWRCRRLIIIIIRRKDKNI